MIGTSRLCGTIAIAILLLLLFPHGITAQTTDLELLSRRFLTKSVTMRDEAQREARRIGLPIREVADDGTVFELQGIVDGIPLYYITLNAGAAMSTRTDLVHQRIGGGEGMVIGIWDADVVRQTHRELAGRVTLAERIYAHPDNHATHVAGTMIAAGVRPEARGMAHEARIVSYDWSDALAEGALAASDGLLITNHSWGHARGWSLREIMGNFSYTWYGDVAISEREDYRFGFYDEDARDWDELARAAPYCLIVTSAGNDRDDRCPPGTEHRYYDSRTRSWQRGTDARDPDGGVTGYDCLPDGKPVAKNLLVVGAVTDVYSYGGPADVRMTFFSSWGPTDDGRIKPDIAGNGNMVYSCIADSDTSYGVKTGTSMSSPNVCGSLALLQDFYRDRSGGPMRAATLKALALHTAREAGNHPGPDYVFGWGLLDTYAAYELLRADLDERRGAVNELTMEEGRPLTLYYECDGTVPELRATICWHDPPGTSPEPALDPHDIMLVHDLDLRVSTRKVEYEPWVLDPEYPWRGAARGDNRCDNVEQVRVPRPEKALYAVTIDHKGSLAGGSQDFSLIVSGAVRVRTWHVRADGSGDTPDISSAVASALEGDHIFMYPGTYHEHDVVINRELTITGVGGADGTVVDAGSNGRCFIFDSPRGRVRLEGITLTGGLARGEGVDGCGGAVLCENSDAVIANCRILDSKARCGGGIGVFRAEPSIVDCVVANNEAADDGGGIHLDNADITLERCLVVRNTARDDGGGVYCNSSSPGIDRCTISHNDAAGSGGGIYAGFGSEPRVTASIVSFSVQGEGVYCYPSHADVVMHCCNVYGNKRGNYGGVIFDRTGRNGNISVDPLFCDPDGMEYGIGNTSPCRPDENECRVIIGAEGVRCLSGTTCRVEPDGTGDMPTIQEAIDAVSEGDTIILAAGIYGGPGNRDISFRGKAILVRREKDTFGDDVIINCSDVSGGHHCGFEFSSGEDSSSILEGVIITGAARGGILCTKGSSPTITGCSVRECKHAGGCRGGGIYLENSSAKILETSLTENRTSGSGGGIACVNSSPLLLGCRFYWNAAEENGGGISVTGRSAVVIRDNELHENSASLTGGGIYCDSSTVEVVDCHLYNNRASSGGGIHCERDMLLSVVRTTVGGNRAEHNGGGISSISSAFIENCTITNNFASEDADGAGIYCMHGDSVSVRKTIVAFNSASEGIFTVNGDIDAACCDVYGNDGGNYGGATSDLTGVRDNISVDPDFCGYAGGIFDVSPCAPANSPCGELVGAMGVTCSEAPDLDINDIIISEMNPVVGTEINVYVEVRNIGRKRAGAFSVDFYFNSDYGPYTGERGDRICHVDDGLAVGDSVLCAFMGITNDTPEEWSPVFSVDVEDVIVELTEYNNTLWGSGTIVWRAAEEPIPGITRLRSICPNPSRGEATIRLDLHRPARVTLAIFDVAGRRIRLLSRNEPMPAGRHDRTWDGRCDNGRPVASGIYFCRLSAGGVEDTKKLLLLR